MDFKCFFLCECVGGFQDENILWDLAEDENTDSIILAYLAENGTNMKNFKNINFSSIAYHTLDNKYNNNFQSTQKIKLEMRKQLKKLNKAG